jgi:hypothetical protein
MDNVQTRTQEAGFRTQAQIDEQNRLNDLNRNDVNRNQYNDRGQYGDNQSRDAQGRLLDENRVVKPYITTGNNQNRANSIRELKAQLSEMKASIAHAVGIIENKIDSLA